ncbi:exodeoxyribonuclease V alpha subunit [Actinomadura pelletieri DSM 43383]|uniref:Exodeoxyribonuclease V alpha subunit n=1 Tax=Actinomadura pelletieri DSM 43383 TaxID=1120940 RepID=A0A495QLI5_9ACTN|nr:helix-hairpin-helix domain-containing protein [Actinomadura pelletieri]RKS73366.1 exodeoxyribonuclease V alpha subunit [Actinomadura pelletieri DSM 43383]
MNPDDRDTTPAERAARAAEAMRAAEAAARAARPPARPSTPPRAQPSPAAPDAREGLRALTDLFAETGVPAPLASRTAARLGPGAAGRLRDDPWRLLRVPGVGPRQADHFARAVLGPDARPGDPRRGRALVLHLLTEAARGGHTVTPTADVVSALERVQVADPRRAVEDALDEAEVLALTEEPEFDEEAFEEDAEPPEPEETLGPARWALAEEAAAEGFRRLTLTAEPLLDDVTVKGLRDGLPEDRSLALTAALRTGVSVLRGTPRDLTRTALDIATAAAGAGLRAAVATPTDRAAADLPAAVTSLHRLLEPRDDPSATPGTVVYGRGEQRPLDLDLVIVTDASALDVELCAVLVEACPDGAHLLLCAEPDAPPPAGPGLPLDDLEASETVPVVTLDSAPPSDPLGTLTEAARGGDLVAVDAPGHEVVVVPADGPEEAVHRTVQLVTDSIPRALGIPVDDVQVVTPTTGGDAGATALNTALKARLNPGPGKFGGLDPGDRVVVAAPLPHAAVGETGTVTGGGTHGLDVEFPAGPTVITPADASRLRPGWAITIDQARGTPRPAIVAVMTPEGLSRPLVTTAFGLAHRHLSVVQAAGPALAKAVRDTPAPPRRTRLARLMTQ